MAKQFIDIAVEDARDDVAALSDGTALTLTNAVRILIDDTVPKSDLMNAIDRAKERINELLD